MKHTNTTVARQIAKYFQKLLEKEKQASKLSTQLTKIEADIDLLKRVIQQQLTEENYIDNNSATENKSKG